MTSVFGSTIISVAFCSSGESSGSIALARSKCVTTTLLPSGAITISPGLASICTSPIGCRSSDASFWTNPGRVADACAACGPGSVVGAGYESAT